MSDFYQPLRETLPPLELDVRIPNRMTGAVHRVHISCRHLLYREFAGLDDLLIGEVQPVADPTGLQMMKMKRTKLKAVLEKVSNLDPGVYAGGEISGKEELAKWVDADENSDAVWASWIVYERSIDSPMIKSKDESRSDSGGSDEGSAQAAVSAP